MTWAVDQPHRHQYVRRSEVVTPSGIRATVRPLGAGAVGLLAALVGAWGGICVFVGPYFGYRPTSATTWDWTKNNWLLHLLPGAVAVAAGLMILTLSPVKRARGIRGPLGLAALLVTACGAWFVIGPALWPTFQSTPAFATGTGAWTSFWNQLGANLGPGLLLAFFGGMALKASIARPAVAVGEPIIDAGEPGVATAATGAGTVTPEDRGVSDQGNVTTAQPAVADYGDERSTEDVGGRRAGDVGEPRVEDVGEPRVEDVGERRAGDVGEPRVEDVGERRAEDLDG